MKKSNRKYSALISSDASTIFPQAPKAYVSDTTYFQVFIFELSDGTLLLSELIFSEDKSDSDNECKFLGFPAIINYCEDGSLELQPYHTDILFFDDVEKYCIPTDEALEQYEIFKCDKGNYYTLTNGEDSQKKYPNTFHMPARRERENIAIGTNVKLIFKENLIENYDDYISEKMWVTVIEFDNGLYTGTINNIPCPDTFMQYGDVINFSAKHIVDIEPQYISSLVA